MFETATPQHRPLNGFRVPPWGDPHPQTCRADFREKIVKQAFAANVKQFLVSEDGPTAVEYAVMLALILVVCLSIVTALGTNARGTFGKVNGALS